MSLLSNLLRKQSARQSDAKQSGQQSIHAGDLLSNRYLVSETLGHGAMGEVYLGEDTVLGGVSVAIKVISQAVTSKHLQEKFSREAQIGAFLGHHNVNIVRVLDFGIHNGEIPFYVMEYVYGSTLDTEISRQPLELDRCIKLMSQVCAGLQSAHQGVLIDKKLYSVLHRDLKPANIFITSNSSFGEIAKILDFGIAEFFLPTHKSTEAEAMGTLAYASSQQLSGQKLEPNADIYSLGVTMFEALTGELPIQPNQNTVSAWIQAHSKQPPRTLKETAPHRDIPPSVEHLIQKCLAKNPSKRPQAIQEVLDSLQQISQSIGAKFPLKTQSHDEVLQELFNRETSQSTANPQPVSMPPRTAAPPTQNLTIVDIQPTQQVRVQTQQLSVDPTHIAQQLRWPADKPTAEIIFAQSVQSPELEKAAIWAMLQSASSQRQALSHHHIEFAVQFEPHPMLAWVTVLHDRQGHIRCLPCFIDLVNPQRQHLLQRLIQQSSYLFLLFDLQNSAHPVKTENFKINARQQQFLHKCVVQTQRRQKTKHTSAKEIAFSKQKLKAHYQQLKAKLPQKLTSKL